MPTRKQRWRRAPGHASLCPPYDFLRPPGSYGVSTIRCSVPMPTVTMRSRASPSSSASHAIGARRKALRKARAAQLDFLPAVFAADSPDDVLALRSFVGRFDGARRDLYRDGHVLSRRNVEGGDRPFSSAPGDRRVVVARIEPGRASLRADAHGAPARPGQHQLRFGGRAFGEERRRGGFRCEADHGLGRNLQRGIQLELAADIVAGLQVEVERRAAEARSDLDPVAARAAARSRPPRLPWRRRCRSSPSPSRRRRSPPRPPARPRTRRRVRSAPPRRRPGPAPLRARPPPSRSARPRSRSPCRRRPPARTPRPPHRSSPSRRRSCPRRSRSRRAAAGPRPGGGRCSGPA